MTLACDKGSKLFGLISVYHQMEYSLGGDNKHGLPSNGGSHFFEQDFAYVPLFDHDWINPVDMTDGQLVYFQSPAVRLSSFSSFISVQMELYVTKKNECHQVCNQNKVIDLSGFWGKKLDGECGCLSVNVEQGSTRMYYILLKDAVDTALEVKFVTETNFLRQVAGYVVAYYGDEFLYDSKSEPSKDCYFALLFLPKPPYSLQASTFPLIKSRLAVPTMGSLIVKAYFEDFYSGEVILNNNCKFKPELGGWEDDTINGSEGCSLKVDVVWDPEDSYL